MITAFILIKVERDRIAACADELLAIPAIAEAYSVAGKYDIIAIARVRQNEQLAKLVTEEMIKVKGIIDTTTIIAFRQYSKHDLERLFGLA